MCENVYYKLQLSLRWTTLIIIELLSVHLTITMDINLRQKIKMNSKVDSLIS